MSKPYPFKLGRNYYYYYYFLINWCNDCAKSFTVKVLSVPKCSELYFTSVLDVISSTLAVPGLLFSICNSVWIPWRQWPGTHLLWLWLTLHVVSFYFLLNGKTWGQIAFPPLSHHCSELGFEGFGNKVSSCYQQGAGALWIPGGKKIFPHLNSIW